MFISKSMRSENKIRRYSKFSCIQCSMDKLFMFMEIYTAYNRTCVLCSLFYQVLQVSSNRFIVWPHCHYIFLSSICRGTFVQNKQTFWVGVQSSALIQHSAPAGSDPTTQDPSNTAGKVIVNTLGLFSSFLIYCAL